MPYHLGVAKTLLSSEAKEKIPWQLQQQERKKPNNLFRLPIKAVSGSSSGSIAATVATLLPHRLDEYTDRFLQDRGYAFRNLREMLLEETETLAVVPSSSSCEEENESLSSQLDHFPLLSICTTRCSDGSIRLFSFDACRQQQDEHERERLIKAIEASCRIPQSFHPLDVVVPNYENVLQRIFVSWSSRDVSSSSTSTTSADYAHTYPDEEGIEIDGDGFVDGGIAGPFPPTPLDGDSGCTGRIVVSPISGEYFYQRNENDYLRAVPSSSPPRLSVVRPQDASRKLSLVNSLTLSGGTNYYTTSEGDGNYSCDYKPQEEEEQQQCRRESLLSDSKRKSEVPVVAVRARPSMQNLRAMITALGVNSAGSSTTKRSPGDNHSDEAIVGNGGGVLRDWLERGQADAHEMLTALQREQ